MCQMSIVLERDGLEEKIMDQAAKLDVQDDQITISTLFEESKSLSGVKVQSIDFLSGRVVLINSK